MDQITDPAEQQHIIHSANCFYRLYGDIFRTLTPQHGIEKLPAANAAQGFAAPALHNPPTDSTECDPVMAVAV
jgi:hypothetical protein